MIKGQQRQNVEFSKQIGIAEFNLVAINPDLTDLKELFPNMTLEKEPKYVIEKSDDDGDYQLASINLYLEDTKTKMVNKTNILISSRERQSKDGKYQYINNIGNTVWAENEEELKDLATAKNPKEGYRTYVQNFLKRPYRVALNGEEAFYDFVQKYTRIDTRDTEAELYFSSKKWFKEDFSELQKDLLDPSYTNNTIVGTYEIVSKRVDAHTDETTGNIIPESWKHYQGIYNRFLPGSYLKSFNPGKTVYPKYVQSWIDQLIGDNGSKNFFAKKVNNKYVIELARDYVESENPLTSESSKHDEEDIPEHVGKDDLPF